MNATQQQSKEQLDNLARLHQMKLNSRLTALEVAHKLMCTDGYTGIAGAREGDGKPAWVKPPGAVDHITLLAIAQDVEAYILGTLEAETLQALDEAAKKLNSPRIVRP